MRQLLALLLVAWLPGAALFRVPWLDRSRRAALDAEERVFWNIILSLALSLSVSLALASLERYTFERLLIVNTLVTLLPVAIFRGRLLLGTPQKPGWSALVPIALVVLAFWRFSPPSEYVVGGKDPGTYMNEGIQIAQTGSLVIREPVVAAVPPFARELFFPRHFHGDGSARDDYYGVRFMGFRVNDPQSGEVIGQFPHLFPASIAIGYGVAGLTGARWVTPVWAVLGVLAVYFVGVRLFTRRIAAVAAVLLALNVVQVWFAGYPNAEVVMQALLFAALLGTARAQVDGDRFFAAVAGVVLGLLLFLRLDALLPIGSVAAGLMLGVLAGRRVPWTIAAAVGAIMLAALPYLLGPMRAYSFLYVQFVRNLQPWHVAFLVLLTLLLMATVRVARQRPHARDVLLRWFPIGVAAVLCAAGVYALLWRHPGGRLAVHDAYALRTLANFYVTVPAIIAALVGYCLYARKTFRNDPALFVTVASVCLFTFYKIRIVPEHFWAARRFLPVVLPAVLLFAVAAALGSGGAGWRGRFLRPVLGAIFVLLLGVHYFRASAPVANHVEYAGLIPKIEQLAAHFTADDLVIIEGRDARSDVHVVGAPLAYIYGLNVLELKPARPDKSTFAEFLEWAYGKYGRIFFVGGGGTDLLSHRYDVRPIASERFQVPEYDSSLNAYPRGVRRKEFEFGVYEFTRAAPRPPAGTLWFELDVGRNDDLHVLRFHAKEITEGRTFRWTGATSYLSVTNMPPGARVLTLVLADGGRPAAAPAARVDVFLHNQQVGSVEVEGSFKPYAMPVPADLAARAAAANDPVELRLVTTTWKPSAVLGSPDDRELGVMLDRVTVK